MTVAGGCAFVMAITCGIVTYQDIRGRRWFDAALFGGIGLAAFACGLVVERMQELVRYVESMQ